MLHVRCNQCYHAKRPSAASLIHDSAVAGCHKELQNGGRTSFP